MKTSSKTSTRLERNYPQSILQRAKRYAANALLSAILRKYYTILAKAMKFPSPSDAAMYEYLEHPGKVRKQDKRD